MVTSAAVECGLGTCPPESLAPEEVQAFEKMHVAWKPPEQNPPLFIDKVYPTGFPENPGVIEGATKPLNNYYDIEHELHLSGEYPLGAPCPGHIFFSFL